MRPLSLKGHDRPLTRVRINHDGDLLFSAGKNKSPCVWYMDNGERIGTYEGHNGAIWDIDVTWDARFLVSASADNSIKVWDVETGSCNHTLKLPTVGRSMSLSYSGNLAAFTTTKITQNSATLRVVDLRDADQMDGKSHVLMQILEHGAESCVWSHLDDTVVIGCTNGKMEQFDIREGRDPINFSSPHHYNISDLQVSADQSFIISSSADKTAQLHNARNLEPLKKYKSGRPVNSAAISPVRDHIVLGGGEEAIQVTHTAASSGQFEAKLYHMVFEEEFARFKGHFGPINSLAYHPSGNIIVTGGEDGYVRIQELDDEYLTFDYDY